MHTTNARPRLLLQHFEHVDCSVLRFIYFNILVLRLDYLTRLNLVL